ncbi:MAG: tRNA (adenosine(37)-N6)-dimethylallyltransferase MiaA [Candidatus Jorgensenbacteria bacterium]|nr:tRNA (adenosine(37)-N6)-dimethylallyltransferase MiaA [Candidatus Jorgensenbacteria bacterium]
MSIPTKTRKLIVVLGPTASGKSDLAVEIAKHLPPACAGMAQAGLNGEIISADSRQVYRGMDIGTGKVLRDHRTHTRYEILDTKYLYRGIPHHLLDVASPKRTFTVAQYQKLARKALEDIWKRGKLPIICGGTGFYIQSVVDGLVLPEVGPNPLLRKKLAKKTTDELFRMLKKKDPARARTVDSKNRVRLIRAIEIAETLGKVPKLKTTPVEADMLIVGINPDKNLRPANDVKMDTIFPKSSNPEGGMTCHTTSASIIYKTENAPKLRKRILKRLLKRIDEGMIEEIVRLHKNGVSWKKLESFGLEYRYGALLLQNKISRGEFIKQLTHAINQYAKRQMTWFKRDKRIHWIKNEKEALRLTKQFVK